MLRFLVLLLCLANGAYFAWSQGLVKAWGYAPMEASEPQRLGQQIRPELIRVLRADEARRLDATVQQAATRPAECLLAGAFDETQAAALRRSLETSLPAGAWQLERVDSAARWIVYMGKYPNVQTLTAKRAEIASLKLKFEALNDPALEPGLSLGSFASKEEADSSLAALSKRGVRTAKVLQARAPDTTWQLRLPAVDDALRPRLDDIRPLLAGQDLRACN